MTDKCRLITVSQRAWLGERSLPSPRALGVQHGLTLSSGAEGMKEPFQRRTAASTLLSAALVFFCLSV